MAISLTQVPTILWMLLGIGLVLLLLSLFGLAIPIGSFTVGDVGIILFFGSILYYFGYQGLNWSSTFSAVIGYGLPVLIVLMLAFFLRPLLVRSERSIVYSDAELIGVQAVVITEIPVDGLGEVLITTATNGNLSRPAALDKTAVNSTLTTQTKVIITGRKPDSHTVYVKPFVPFLSATDPEQSWQDKKIS